MADNENKELKTTENAAPAADTAKSAKVSKPAKKDKLPIGKRIAAWFRTYKAELKKIVWASPSSVFNNTALVLVFMVVIAAVIGVLDYVFNQSINGLSAMNLF